jgi:hypothetical protein
MPIAANATAPADTENSVVPSGRPKRKKNGRKPITSA